MNLANTLTLMFVPALAVQLEQAESHKREALTEVEVLRLTAQATKFPVPASLKANLEDSRGFKDISPGRVWEEWQQRRHSQWQPLA